MMKNYSQYVNLHSHAIQPVEGSIRIRNYFPSQIKKLEKVQEEYYSIGIHPWYIVEKDLDNNIELIERIANDSKCIAIGEIGLDRLVEYPLEKQFNLFTRQLSIAENKEKPIIIHCVKAFSELLNIKKSWHPQIPWVIHGYNNNIEIANELIKHNCYLSFGYHLTIDNSNAQKVFRTIPENKLFLETDDKNISIQDVYKKASEIKNIKLEKLIEIVYSNFKSVFIKDEQSRMVIADKTLIR